MSLCLIDVHGDIEGDFDWVVDLPRNATNGDVIKAMFPNASFHYHKASDIVEDYVSVNINDCDTIQDYTMAWWNTPYKENKQ